MALISYLSEKSESVFFNFWPAVLVSDPDTCLYTFVLRIRSILSVSDQSHLAPFNITEQHDWLWLLAMKNRWNHPIKQ